MKRFVTVLALLLTAAAPPARHAAAPAPVAPPVAGDWNSLVRVSPEGTYVIGNPRAPVKVIEYLSFTCSHCAAFARDSAATLRGQMIKSGSVLIEYRPAVRDQADLAVTLLLKCIGPRRYADAAESIFTHQDDWLGMAYRYLQNDAPRFALDPVPEQLRTLVKLGGIASQFQRLGMSEAEIDRCLGDAKSLQQTAQVAAAGSKIITGTPTFIINGVKQKPFEWPGIESTLRAKGAK